MSYSAPWSQRAPGGLISVGLADLRGALHLGIDEASWLGTAFNAGLMFIGPILGVSRRPAGREARSAGLSGGGSL